jgi:hypothetical protein
MAQDAGLAMTKLWTGLGRGALVMALSIGAAAPASAEFFGCNDKDGRVVASYIGTPSDYGKRRIVRTSSRYTHEFAAQASRPRITIQPRTTSPGPNAKRYCRSWLAKEYRVSGTVIVPRMQCWWR